MLKFISRLSPSMTGMKVTFSRIILVSILVPLFSFVGLSASFASTVIPVNYIQSTYENIYVSNQTISTGVPGTCDGFAFLINFNTGLIDYNDGINDNFHHKLYALYGFNDDLTTVNGDNQLEGAYIIIDGTDHNPLQPIYTCTNFKHYFIIQFTPTQTITLNPDNTVNMNSVAGCLNLRNGCPIVPVVTIGTMPDFVVLDPTPGTVEKSTPLVCYEYFVGFTSKQLLCGPAGGPILPYTGSGTVTNTCTNYVNDFGTYKTQTKQKCTIPLVTGTGIGGGGNATTECDFNIGNLTPWVKCIFIPNDLNSSVQKVLGAFNNTFLGTITGVVADLFTPFNAWITTATPDCNGYGIILPMSAFGHNTPDLPVHPMSTCAPIVQKYLPYVMNIMNSFIYLSTLFMLLNILFGAFGLKFNIFKGSN